MPRFPSLQLFHGKPTARVLGVLLSCACLLGCDKPKSLAPATSTLPVEKEKSFDVVLKDAGTQKIQVIKVIRAATGLGLKDAKDLVDGAPKTVRSFRDQAEAAKLKKALEAEGATVELR
jgi:ribosomal protein L7/L12